MDLYYRKPRPELTARSVIASIRPIYATILAPDVQYERSGSRWAWVPVSPSEHTSSEDLYTSPVPPRRLSIRECARLQTFPDDFRFLGTLLDKHRVIGSAAPCELSRRNPRGAASCHGRRGALKVNRRCADAAGF